tara:strand:+ start:24 stop:662 length:639 start_codon:yes stop_codon:yes gene_type:complete
VIDSFIVFIEKTLIPFGPWGVFVATILEQIIAPIPSAIVQLAGGFFLIEATSLWDMGVQVFFLVALPSAVAVCLGALLIYALSFYFGKKFVEKWGWWFGVSWDNIEKIQQHFNHSRRDIGLLFVLRTLPVVPTVAVDVFCGIIRFRIRTYIIITFFGTLIRAFIFGVIGWKVGSLYHYYADVISRIEQYVLLAIGVIVLALIIHLWYKKRTQ